MRISQLYKLFLESKGVTTDTRKVQPGNLFFALKGERFDGNRFAGEALDKGAAYAIVDDPQLLSGERMILVPNALETLQQLANHHRRQFEIPFIGITGSNGKTTTKELVSGVLSTHFKCHSTAGNLNNHIGVPLTLLAVEPDTQIAVIEMGANHQKEIAFLAEIAEPDYGLITNIGKAHLEGFGGIEGVKKGKGELYDFLAAHGGTAFVNIDEKHLPEMAERVPKRITYGQGIADCQIKLIQSDPYVSASFTDSQAGPILIDSQLFGVHNFNNIATAIAVGQYFEVPADKIKQAIEAYRPQNNRSQVIRKGHTEIILDAYNANPTSVRMALIHLANRTHPTKIAILGSMLELGPDSEQEHEKITALALSLGIDQIVLVGQEFKQTAQDHNLPYYEDVKALKPWWDKQRFEDTVILIKGSRRIELEKILES